jgi:cysteine-rich repeat protein
MNSHGWFGRFATVWLVLLTMGYPAQAWGWSKSFDGDNVGNSAGKVVALAGGDAVAYASVGVRYYPGGYDVIDKLIRFSGASGEEVWRSANALGQESAGALMATPGGDLYSSSYRGGVMRVRETDGVRLWGGNVAGTCGGYNTFTWFGGLAAHPSGDVVLGATGCVDNSSNVAKFTVGRLNASDGSLVWHTQVESQPPSDRQPSGSSLAVAADAAGDVVGVGELAPPQGRQLAIVKFDGGSGQELWRYALSGTENSRATAVAIDSQQNIVVAGTVSGVFTVCKFGPTGLPLWNTSPITSEPIGCRQQFFLNDPSRVFQGSALLAAVDGNNNVIVGGYADVCTGRSVLLIKLAAFDGSPVWSGLNSAQPTCPPFATQLTTPGSATQMVVGSAGDIAIVGQGTSHWVAKVAGDTGVELWSKPFPKLGTMQDVALDEMGNALVAGTDNSGASCRGADALVAKLRGSDGAIAPSCGDHVVDVDEECDDGDTNDNDGCSADCTVEHGCCGDGIKFGVGEECDDGNTFDGDLCSSQCQLSSVSDPVKDYAPIVRLHPDEQYLPDDPGRFIDCSRIEWRHASPICGRLVGDYRKPKSWPTAKLSPDLLSRGRFSHRSAGTRSPRNAFSCGHIGRRVRSGNQPRPNVIGPPLPPSCVAPGDPSSEGLNGDGFFLKLASDSCRIGNAPWPMFYDDRRNTDQSIVYWFFYDYNSFPYGPGYDEHEGDWENITVHLDANGRLDKVAYFCHGSAKIRAVGDFLSEGTHPKAFSSLGGHASYPDGRDVEDCPFSVVGLPGPDVIGLGAQWQPLSLRDITKEPWYWYGGAWGDYGSAGLARTGGPTGPGHCGKTGVPGQW